MKGKIIFLMVAACLFSAALCAEETINAGSFTSVGGAVEIQSIKDGPWEKAEVYMPVYPGDHIRTAEKSSAELILDDGSMLRLEEKTLIFIEGSSVEEGNGEDGRKAFFLNL